MKIIVLYGPGEVGKRNEALRIKKTFSEEAVTRIDLKQNSQKDLEVAVAAQPLFFQDERLILVENVGDKLDLQQLSRQENLTLLLLAGAIRSDSTLIKSTKAMGAKLCLFEGEKEVSAFPYLDNLIEGKKQAFVELNKLLDGYGGMYILSMIYYLLRRNLLPLPASSFMQGKIKNQKKHFTTEDWQGFYYQTLQVEFRIKSGVTTEDLALIDLSQRFISRCGG